MRTIKLILTATLFSLMFFRGSCDPCQDVTPNDNNYCTCYPKDPKCGSNPQDTTCSNVTPPISPPTSFFAKAVNLSQVQLTWNQISNATNYIIYKNNQYLAETSSLFYNDNFTLTAQQQYEYYVVASNSSDTSTNSRICATSYTSGNLSATHTSDTWNIALPQDREMYLIVSVDPSLNIQYGCGYPNGIVIYDGNGVTQIFGAPGPTGGNQTSVTIGPFEIKAGNYTVRICRYSGNGNYTLTSYYSQTRLNNDNEPNDGISSAVVFNFDTRITGHLGYVGGGNGTRDIVDFYNVNLSEDKNIIFNINIDPSLNLQYGCGYPNGILVLKNDGITVEKSFPGPTGGNNTSLREKFPLYAGNYYIKICRYDGFGGYDFKLCIDN
ncbi:MAG: hypothetical protein K8I03_11285 [Ignavibacteria bacterium]|nr:hypothetical protein [Ignavibacteria bacterium]